MDLMKKYYFTFNFFLCIIIGLISLTQNFSLNAQAISFPYSDESMVVGTGLGFSSGSRESGLGLNFLVGWQKAVGQNKRIEINPYITFGTYKAFAIPTDTREQLFKSTNLGVDSHFHFSFLTLTAGLFANYTRGMYSDEGYFNDTYYGFKGAIGFKIKSQWEQLSYELKPFNVLVGNNGFLQGYAMYTMKIKLKKK